MHSKQRNGPEVAILTGRPRSQVAATATITAAIVSDGHGNRQDPPRGYRVEDLPSHIQAHVAVDPESGCWVSDRNIDKDGYSRLGGDGVHRIVWRELVGPIPAGLVLDHVRARGCRWNACCFPGHLEPVTNRENILRGRSFAAINAAKQVCDHGHRYTEANTYRTPDGRRDCRACIRRRVAEYKARLRGGEGLLGRAA